MRYFVPVRDSDGWKLYQVDVGRGPFTALKIVAARARLEDNDGRGRGSKFRGPKNLRRMNAITTRLF